MWNFIRNNPQIIYIILIVGLPLLGRVLKTLGEAKQRNQMRKMQEQAQAELLRTGKAEGGTSEAVRQSRQRDEEQRSRLETARRRQMQAEQTRAAAAARNAGNARTAPTQASQKSQTVKVQLPGGMVLELPAPPQQQKQQGGRSPAERQARAERRRQQEAAKAQAAAAAERQRRDAQTRAEAAKSDAYAIEGQGAGKYAAPAGQAAPSVARIVTRASTMMPTSVDEWRKAFILREVFERPVGLREDEERAASPGPIP